MKCPVCKEENFESKEIEPNLFAEVCSKCLGKWISSDNYNRWLAGLEGRLPEIPSSDEAAFTIREFELAKLCPQCRRILVKYKIGRNIAFKIDRCGNCAGVWLDSDEWATLRSRNLHDELNKVFTDHWQEEVKKEETRQALEKIYAEKFGEDDYRKIKDFKTWIEQHEKSSEIKAFIRDKNPLQF
ncbi:MAG: zf-TFIIB domain-containing protein [Pyrinomonadaceae bacterium]|nr:zf-TFIIB domain-containing protein [Pyrinomonadaceae bacterium]